MKLALSTLAAAVALSAFAIPASAQTSCYNCCKAKLPTYGQAKRGNKVYDGAGDYGSQWRCPYYQILVKGSYGWEAQGTCYVQSQCQRVKQQPTYN